MTHRRLDPAGARRPTDAVAGLRTGLRAAPRRSPDRAATRERSGPWRRGVSTGHARWLTEHEAEGAARVMHVPEGRVVTRARGHRQRTASSVKASRRRPPAQGGDRSGRRLDPPRIRARRSRSSCRFTGEVLVERLLPPGPELFVAVRTDTIVPVLVVGLGGALAEALDASTVLPLPVTRRRGRRRAARRRPQDRARSPSRATHVALEQRPARCSSSTPSSRRHRRRCRRRRPTEEDPHERHRRPARRGRPARSRSASSPPRRGTPSSSAAATTA